MKIGILVPTIGNFGQKGFYNAMEIGLAKEFAKRGHSVVVYKCVAKDKRHETEQLQENLIVNYISAKKLGSNALLDTKYLDKSLHALMCFSDIQMCVPSVYKWAISNHVVFIPYIGIIESKAKSKWVRYITNVLAKRINSIYGNVGALTQNTRLKNKLLRKGYKNIDYAPVGLDLDLVNPNFETVDSLALKEKYGIEKEDKVYLLIGRLTEQRDPLDCIPTFEALHQADEHAKLLAIGKGNLKEAFFERIEAHQLTAHVKYIEQVPNDKMWEIYHLGHALLSFSRMEIVGMSIMESMYYKTPVYALHAPGPDDILVHEESGFLFDTPQEMTSYILTHSVTPSIIENARKRIFDKFTWKTAADMMLERM